MLSIFGRLANPYESPFRQRRRLSALHVAGGFILGAAFAVFLVRHPDPSAAFADWHIGVADKAAPPVQVVALHSAVNTDASAQAGRANAASAEEILPPAPDITSQPGSLPEAAQIAEAPTGTASPKSSFDAREGSATTVKPKQETAKHEAKKPAPKPVRTAHAQDEQKNHKTRRPRAQFVETLDGRRLVYRQSRDFDDDDFGFGDWAGYRQRSFFPTFD